MLPSQVIYAVIFALAVVSARFALALVTSEPADWAGAKRTLAFPLVAVILIGWASGLREITAAPGGGEYLGVPDVAVIAKVGAWVLVGSVGIAILLWTSARAFRAWRSRSAASPRSTVIVWLLILLPVIVVVCLFAASGLTWG